VAHDQSAVGLLEGQQERVKVQPDFFSRHANQRDDAYGGDLPGRSRFLLETLAAVREVWPEHLPLTVRFGVIEFDGHDEQTLAESIELARAMREGGLDLLNVSVGFSTPDAKIPWGPAFLAPITGRRAARRSCRSLRPGGSMTRCWRIAPLPTANSTW
jgi:2,4-dienoyl-CoA reductase-like NADH-dependent reductase (Old Yellow Enzyme family)